MRKSILDDTRARLTMIPKHCTLQGCMEQSLQQFWDIRGRRLDPVELFKKGELYENDADIGDQQSDLKPTDRTNMRMVDVPASSFDHWAAPKVTGVNQIEA